MEVHLGYNAYVLNSLQAFNCLAALPGPRNQLTDIVLLADTATPGLLHDWSDEQGLTSVPDRPVTFGMATFYCANGPGAGGATCQGRHRDHGVNVIHADSHAAFLPGGRIRGGNADLREWPVVNPNKLAWK